METRCEVRALAYGSGVWTVDCGNKSFSAPVVVNAAGAWADTIASSAGMHPLGITPKRRSACLVDAPTGVDIADWPLVIDADEAFYFKPDAGALLISPADETPSVACDAQAEELDIAIAIERFMQATQVEVRRVTHRWAGLRSFAPDKTIVVGFDPRVENFFWLAGQGGYGVQSAPALAKLVQHLVTGVSLTDSFAGLERYVETVSPERLLTPHNRGERA